MAHRCSTCGTTGWSHDHDKSKDLRVASSIGSTRRLWLFGTQKSSHHQFVGKEEEQYRTRHFYRKGFIRHLCFRLVSLWTRKRSRRARRQRSKAKQAKCCGETKAVERRQPKMLPRLRQVKAKLWTLPRRRLLFCKVRPKAVLNDVGKRKKKDERKRTATKRNMLHKTKGNRCKCRNSSRQAGSESVATQTTDVVNTKADQGLTAQAKLIIPAISDSSTTPRWKSLMKVYWITWSEHKGRRARSTWRTECSYENHWQGPCKVGASGFNNWRVFFNSK